MKVTYDAAKNEYTIVIKGNDPKNPPPSNGGKTCFMASTGGFSTTDLVVEGKQVKASVMLTVPNK